MKQNKADVDYSAGDMRGDHCGACVWFIEPSGCEKVAGKIRASAWCRLYQKGSRDGVPKAAG